MTRISKYVYTTMYISLEKYIHAFISMYLHIFIYVYVPGPPLFVTHAVFPIFLVQISGDSWMHPYQPTPMENPYISPISRGYLWVSYDPQESLDPRIDQPVTADVVSLLLQCRFKKHLWPKWAPNSPVFFHKGHLSSRGPLCINLKTTKFLLWDLVLLEL